MKSWVRSATDRGAPYRAERLPWGSEAWIVVDRGGSNCWTRGTGHAADRSREVAEATAREWNEEERAQ